MARTTLKKTYLAQQDFTAEKENITLAKSGVVISEGHGFYLSVATVSSKVTIAGQVLAEQIGVFSLGENTHVTISKSGLIFGDFAVRLSGDNSRGVNNGTLIADDDIVYLGGDDTRFLNKGVMRGDDAVALVGDDSVFTNGKAGIVEVWTRGMYSLAVSGETTKTVNHGRMENSLANYLFEGGASDDIFINRGVAKGSISLGAGDDVFDGRGGRHKGDIIGGAGNDVLYAGEGNNALFGLDGVDILNGRKGNDSLTGGGDSDRFEFGTRFGVDTITDFEIGVDEINLYRWKAVTDFDDLLDNHAFDKGGNVEFRAGKDKLILLGVSKDDLVETDFNFA